MTDGQQERLDALRAMAAESSQLALIEYPARLIASEALLRQCDVVQREAESLAMLCDLITAVNVDAVLPAAEEMSRSLQRKTSQLVWSIAGEGI